MVAVVAVVERAGWNVVQESKERRERERGRGRALPLLKLELGVFKDGACSLRCRDKENALAA